MSLKFAVNFIFAFSLRFSNKWI